jgi:hypothetical protein
MPVPLKSVHGGLLVEALKWGAIVFDWQACIGSHSEGVNQMGRRVVDI